MILKFSNIMRYYDKHLLTIFQSILYVKFNLFNEILNNLKFSKKYRHNLINKNIILLIKSAE